MKTIVMRMHRDETGQCWADSEDVPGYTAVGEDFYAVMSHAREGVELGMIPWGSDEKPDVRWQWCSNELRQIKATRIQGQVTVVRGRPCPCAAPGKVDG